MFQCPTIDTRLGYELLDQGSFYIVGSNTSELLSLGNQTHPTELLLYIGNDSNIGFVIGVTNPADPTFYITRKNDTSPSFYIQGSTGFLGIGTSQPSYDVDIWGNMRVTGSLTQYNPTSNVVFVTEVISSTSNQVDFLQSASNEYISFTNTPLCNVQSLQVNCNVSIGGELIIHDVIRQYVGNMQHITTSYGHIPYDTTDMIEMGYILSWPYSPHPFDYIQVHTDFFAIGYDTRIALDYKNYLNINDLPPTYPTSEFSSHLHEYQSLNTVSLQPAITRYTSNSVKVGVKWQVVDTFHQANIKLNAWGAADLGPIQVQGYQILANMLSFYQNGGFSNAIFQDSNIVPFPTSTNILGIFRQVVGNMQRVRVMMNYDSFQSTSNEMGFLVSWSNTPMTTHLIHIDGMFYANGMNIHLTSDFVNAWNPMTQSSVSYTNVSQSSATPFYQSLSSTSASLGVRWNVASPVVQHCGNIAMELWTPSSLGLFQITGYITGSSIPTTYYQPSTQTFATSLPSSPTYVDVVNVQRHNMGYLSTAYVSIGDVAFTSDENELGFILSWPLHKTDQIDFECILLLHGDNGIYAEVEFHQTISVDHANATADSIYYKQLTQSPHLQTVNISVAPLAPYQALVGVHWHLSTPGLHTASIRLRAMTAQELGRLEIGAYRKILGNTEMYDPGTQTFSVSPTPIYLSDGVQHSGIIRQITHKSQWITCTFGNMPFTQSGLNRIGFHISWANSIPMCDQDVICVRSNFICAGTTLRMSLTTNQTLRIPDMTKTFVSQLHSMQSEEVDMPPTFNVVQTDTRNIDVYIDWRLYTDQSHVADLWMELMAPLPLGNLQIQGFFYENLL